jgi:hypothetical protein
LPSSTKRDAVLDAPARSPGSCWPAGSTEFWSDRTGRLQRGGRLRAPCTSGRTDGGSALPHTVRARTRRKDPAHCWRIPSQPWHRAAIFPVLIRPEQNHQAHNLKLHGLDATGGQYPWPTARDGDEGQTTRRPRHRTAAPWALRAAAVAQRRRGMSRPDPVETERT